MNCDVCGQEFANSEEIKLHKEREHPAGERDDQELESPDQLDTEPTRPEPVVRPAR